MNNEGNKLFDCLDEGSLNTLKNAGFDVDKIKENIDDLELRKEKNLRHKKNLKIFFNIIHQRNKTEALKSLKGFGCIYEKPNGRLEFRPFNKYKEQFIKYVENYVNNNTNYRPSNFTRQRRRLRRQEKI